MKTPKFKKAFRSAVSQLFSNKEDKQTPEESVDSHLSVQYELWAHLLGVPNMDILFVDIKTNAEDIKKFKTNQNVVYVSTILKELLIEKDLEIFEEDNNILITEKGYYIIGTNEQIDKAEEFFYEKV